MELAEIDTFIQDSDCEVKLFFVKKKRTKDGYKLKAINPTISNNLSSQIKEIVHEEVRRHDQLPLKTYNILGACDDIVEKADYAEYTDKIKELTDEMDDPENISSIKSEEYNFLVYEFSKKDSEKIIAIRRTKSFKKFAQGIAGVLAGSDFNQLKNKNVLGTDNLVDILITLDKIYIFQHISFERVFDLKNEFKEQAEDLLNDTKLALETHVQNYESFKEQALKNGNYVRRLAKIRTKSTNQMLFLQHMDKTKEAIQEFDLNIKVLKDDKISFEDESQISDIIHLMQDSYYRTIIGDQKGIDEER
ncbi:DUF4868 domain-containing protein [Lactobacillus helveticus]|uniref:Kiwa anti-phage protein KwaB-like domain-containing protein n=1 Tax=Lactobacillus helveticus TaxID=1587 RepID=UPI001C1E4CE1|nr:Kiwa anti-phage protein KwaB-like domain-containing protein [Lactobacillus helveticus]MBU5981276.1 DUF4868 domain-containing protein [Lactobacillus helveticus]MCT3414130.1 DUF4868 domain-containing protein [Lactobacillus helveticus]